MSLYHLTKEDWKILANPYRDSEQRQSGFQNQTFLHLESLFAHLRLCSVCRAKQKKRNLSTDRLVYAEGLLFEITALRKRPGWSIRCRRLRLACEHRLPNGAIHKITEYLRAAASQEDTVITVWSALSIDERYTKVTAIRNILSDRIDEHTKIEPR